MVQLVSIPLTIELADVVDLADCRKCLDESGLESQPLRHRLKRLIQENQVWVARTDENLVIGTIGFDASICRGSLFAQFMGVRAAYQHRGVETALLNHCVEFARNQRLGHLIADVPTDNTVMSTALTAWGFRRITPACPEHQSTRTTHISDLWGLRLSEN